jgi:hypothetical protein
VDDVTILYEGKVILGLCISKEHICFTIKLHNVPGLIMCLRLCVEEQNMCNHNYDRNTCHCKTFDKEDGGTRIKFFFFEFLQDWTERRISYAGVRHNRKGRRTSTSRQLKWGDVQSGTREYLM